MSNLFLQSMMLEEFLTNNIGEGIAALVFAFLFLFLIVLLVLYIYLSLAFVAIAKKTKYETPGIAWIPMVGPALIASNAAKMPRWPIFLLIGALIPGIGGLFSLAFTVFFILWLWKTYERLGKPGWWAILCIIPFVGLVMLGIVAWSKK